MEIKCKVCNHQFSLPVEEAKKVSKKHSGFIPCDKCGSHATSWDVKLFKAEE